MVASALIVFHLTAVFWAPFAFACGPSPFAAAVMNWFRPYCAMMYLDHGYSFFAPDPGPGRLVHYKVEFADGRQPIEGVFPNLQEEQPRLLYHRHFMMADKLGDIFVPPEPPREVPLPDYASKLSQAERRELQVEQEQMLARQTTFWKHRREQYEALRKSLEDHLLTKYGGNKATVTRREHLLLRPDEYLRLGKRLDLPETYVDLPEATVTEVIRP